MLAVAPLVRDTQPHSDAGEHDPMSRDGKVLKAMRRRSAWRSVLTVIFALGAASCSPAWAQPAASVAAVPAALELEPAHLAPLYHLLAGTPAPASADTALVQSLSARGADALRDLPYRFRIPVLLGSGADGLVLEPVLGAPGLHFTLDDLSYELRMTVPVAALLIPEAIATPLADLLVAGRATSAELLVQFDSTEETADGRRVINATLREATVLSVVDGAAAHSIAISPLRVPIAPPPPATMAPAAAVSPPIVDPPAPATSPVDSAASALVSPPPPDTTPPKPIDSPSTAPGPASSGPAVPSAPSPIAATSRPAPPQPLPSPQLPPPATPPPAPLSQPVPAQPAPPETPAPPAPQPPPPAAITPPPPAAVTPPPVPEAPPEPVFVAERAGVLRNAPSARALQVAQIRPGQRFTIVKEQRGNDGQTWAEVKPVDGAPGFMPRKDLITAADWDAPVSGAVTRVVDAATLVIGARTVRLGALDPGPLRFLDVVRPWLTGAASPVTCERRPDAAFDCFSADRRDLGETMILNGLARAGAGAPGFYLEAQDKARQGKKGLWRSAR